MVNDNRNIFQLEIAVRDYELDSEGIVNNARYLHYLEHTRHEFCRIAGCSFKALCDAGIITVVRRIEIEYLTPLRSGDIMVSALWLERKGARFIFHQTIVNKTTGEISVRADVSAVSIENGRLSRGDKLADIFKKYL